MAGLSEFIFGSGYLGVDLFFLLSGFILSYSYSARFKTISLRDYSQFLWNRLARIYPVHLFTLFGMLGLLFLAHSGGRLNSPGMFTSGDFVKNLFLVNAWSYPIHLSWNGPAWTISCEWAAYLAFPFLAFFGILSVRPKTQKWLLPIWFGVFSGICFLGGGRSSIGLARIVFGFIAGCWLFSLFQSKVFSERQHGIWLALSIFGVFIISFFSHKVDMPAFSVVPLLAAILLIVGYGTSSASKLLTLTPMLFLGYISYSLYMVHMPCILILRKLLPAAKSPESPVYGALILGTYILIPLLTAVLTYYLIEKPARFAMHRAPSRLNSLFAKAGK